MTGSDNPQREPWHISRAVSVTHILSTITIVAAVFIFLSEQNSRISSNELNIAHLQQSRVADEARTEKRFDEIRSTMLRIDGKLDQLIRDRSRE